MNPGPGTYSTAQSVAMTSTSGATIRYTTGSTNPTCSTGTVFGGPVAVASTTTLRAIACASGMTDSAVTTGTYTISASAGGSTIQENTAGFCRVEGSISTSDAGYTGAGYANISNSSGKGVNWSVSAPSAGTFTLTFRYENGASSVVTTGATWTTVSFTVTLNAGVNTIRLEATSNGGFANVDYLQVSGNAVGVACN